MPGWRVIISRLLAADDHLGSGSRPLSLPPRGNHRRVQPPGAFEKHGFRNSRPVLAGSAPTFGLARCTHSSHHANWEDSPCSATEFLLCSDVFLTEHSNMNTPAAP